MDGLTRLSAAIDVLASESDDGVPAADLPSRLIGLHRAAARLHAELLRTTASFDAAGVWRGDGAVSAAAWLRHEARVSDTAARDQVRSARLLRDDLPRTGEALATGDIGAEHVRVMTRAATATPQRRASVGSAEPTLVEAARRLGPRALAVVVSRWADAVDPAAGIVDADCAYAARRLSLSTTLNGMVAIDGLLDPESGATVIAAVQALAAPGVGGHPNSDDRTPTQRRADALVQLARAALDTGQLSQSAGDRPHLLIGVDATVLAGTAGGGNLSGSVRDVPIPTAAVLRLACDAVMTPLAVRGGVPVDVGRTTRVISTRMRRFLTARDGGCRFPGCDRPPAWCDAHHVVPWSQGGRTDRANLLLLCRRHHRAVHEGGFAVELGTEAAVSVWRPDGTPLVINERPPPWCDTG